MRYLVTSLCFAMSMSVVSTAAAEDQAPGGDRRAEMRKKIMAEFDVDGDGELSDDERAKAREEMRSRRGARGQGDNPRGERMRRGRQEGQRGGPGGPPDPGQLFDRFDADGDGNLSRAEFMKLTEEMRPPRPPRGRDGAGQDGPPARGEGRRPRFDRDAPLQNPGDEGGRPPRPEGRRRLNDEDGSARRGPRERGQRGPGAGGPEGRRPPSPEAVFERFDENGDDRLSRDEFMKLADRMRQMREGRGGPGARGGRGPGGPRDDDGPRRPARPQFDDGADNGPTEDNSV
ncbi:MAG: hypothetical protein AAGD11_03785 [Planctomycetota bacterium]